MKPIKPKIYVDTSVFGGVFDNEFAKLGKPFIENIPRKTFTITTSEIVLRELRNAPLKVRTFFQDLSNFIEIVDVTNQAVQLHLAYLKAEVVSEKWSADALHVAIATVTGCSLIVSWNFKHIVNYRRIPMYNTVNVMNGYSQITICTPPEVIDENETI
jgi:predicted nucleic acid-binding protein